ncbi:MAG: TraR/DksA C4-type zinc finger protein [Euryarchaeota archaeon]|nr:TraR/DksA C4-type zinc finger protein [Euryarchaeota archaeon]MCG2735420.1 TraR/DksA C4-type zinc finger protein [Candidatus Methanoperedenaceae archaeon]
MRVALRDEANKFSDLMNKWMMRLGKLSHEEEDELGAQLLEMDERYLLIQDVLMKRASNFEKSAISKCIKCGEFVPESLVVRNDDGVHCRACEGTAYYELQRA